MRTFTKAASQHKSAMGLFTWREEDPSARKILEGEANSRLVYMQKFRLGWLLEIEESCRPLEAERPPPPYLFFCP